ncbi:MAG: alpha/beta hydrolase domain-containing protein [Acidimicrobiia bacterium]
MKFLPQRGRVRSLGQRTTRVACLALIVATLAGAAATSAIAATAASDASTATISPIPAGSGTGVAPVGRRAADLAPAGYTETEFLVSGVAHVYSGPATGPASATPQTVPYATRVIVRAPPNPKEFSGRVMVEPMNTSSGGDTDAGWGFIGSRLVENGDAWVGVTVRYSSDALLKKGDPVRYASINIPTSSVAWDVLAQVGQSLRTGGASGPLGALKPKHVYMTGYSQSAIDVATYAGAINPLARQANGKPVFDGFLVMARAASLTPLDPGTAALPAFEFKAVGKGSSPIVEVESEGEAAGFSTPAYSNPSAASVRRADSDAPKDRFRLYEITGGSHVLKGSGCDHPDGTTFPMRYFERAALEHLYAWSEDGTAPPKAPRIKAASIGPVTTFVKDDHGNSVGGVRSPYIDVPLSTYGANDTPGPLCALAGYETPFPSSQLQSEYKTADAYMKQFTKSLDHAIAAGTFLKADRDDILTAAQAIAQQRFAGS